MKKNIFKKIVASLATVAMAAGMFAAMPAEEAKAAAGDKETELILVVSGEKDYDTIYLDINDGTNSQNAGITSPSTPDKKNLGWNREMYVCEKVANTTNMYSVKTKGTLVDGEYCNMQFNFAKDGSLVAGCKYYPQDNKDQFNNNARLYISINLDEHTKDSWKGVPASVKDPTKPDATGVIEAINAIGTVEYKDEVLKKIEAAETAYKNHIKAGGDAADVTNYDKLTAARAKYNELQKADDAKYAGELVIYVKSPGWKEVKLYAWNRGNTTVFGEYPGTAMDKLAKNTGWYAAKFNIDKATNVLFGDGTEQTADWNSLKAGTYWVTLTDKGGDGKYVIAEANISTKAPAGWKDEAAKELETQAPPTTTPAPTTTAKPAVDKGVVASKDDVAKIDKEAVVEGAPADSKLDATEIAADSDAFKVVKEAAKTAFKNKTYVALDLKLLKGTEAVQPNGDVKVTIPVPSALAKATKVAVYRVGDDNKLVSCGTADVANGKLTFTTNHFSTYVFADATPVGKPGDVAPIVLMLAVAAVAAGMVVASKKKTICE